MQISEEDLAKLFPLAQKSILFYNANLHGTWIHQLYVLSKMGASGSLEIKDNLNEVLALLNNATLNIYRYRGNTDPKFDSKIIEDASNLLTGWNKLIKISSILCKILETSFANSEYKRLSQFVIKSLKNLNNKDVEEFIKQYNIAVGAMEILEDETLDKMATLAGGFEKIINADKNS